MDVRSPVGSAGPLVDDDDLLRQFGVMHRAGTRGAGGVGVEGGSGDLEQFTRTLDAVSCGFLCLDERVLRHRVSFAKKAVARSRSSTSSRRRRFFRRSWASSSRSLLVRPSRSPASARPA